MKNKHQTNRQTDKQTDKFTTPSKFYIEIYIYKYIKKIAFPEKLFNKVCNDANIKFIQKIRPKMLQNILHTLLVVFLKNKDLY